MRCLLTARARVLLVVCFFLSGATGLIYEVVWSRYLMLVFGSATDSVAVVLCIYMAGLGIGAAWIGRRVDRGANPTRLYALLEVGVGLFALASPLLFRGVAAAYAAVQGRLDLSPGPSTMLKIGLSVIALFAPTLLMGGTLPALRAALGSQGGRSIGRLYAANTMGAAGGTALAGFVLIEAAGLWRTLLFAALCNLGIALGALALARGRAREPAPPCRREWTLDAAGWYLGVGALLSGALAMLYEIVWTRLLTLVLGPSTYAFSTVLVVFLVGLGLGSALQAKSAARGATALAVVQILSAAAVALLIPVFDALPTLTLYARRLPGLSGTHFLWGQVLFAAILFLPPALLAGFSLPLCIASLRTDESRVGADVGDLYLCNTGGAILGSVLTGFLLVPVLGTENTLRLGIATSALFGLAGGLFGRGLLRHGLLAGGLLLVALAVVAPRWDRNVMDCGIGWRGNPRFRTRLDAQRLLRTSPSELLFWEEGKNATVSVRRHAAGNVTLYVGGKPDASDISDMPTQAFIGALPLLARPDTRRALVVGMGSGVTADRIAGVGNVKHVDLVELEEAVVRASVHFRHVNHDVMRNPRVHLHLTDARSFLNATDRRWDLIVSEPSNPWMAGVSALFSRDYYDQARRRLTQGGLFAQWMQLYLLDADTLRLLFATFASSFPHTQVWYLEEGDLLLLGSPTPIRFSLARMRQQVAASSLLTEDLRVWWGVEHIEDIFGRYLLSDGLLREIVGADPVVATDDRNPIEFRAARGLHGQSADHLRRLWDIKLRAGDLVPPLSEGEVSLAARWLAIARGCPHPPTALQAARRAVALAPADPGARTTLVKQLIEANHLDEAERTLPGTGRDEPSLRLTAALARGRLGEVEALLSAHPELARARAEVVMARARMDRGDTAGAYSAIDRALAKLGEEREADRRETARRLVHEVAALAEQTGDWRRGADLLRLPAWGEMARYARSHILAGFHMRLGQDARALAVLAELERFGPLEPGLLEIKRQALHAAGDHRAARAVGAWLAHADGRGEPLRLGSP